jgi:luciferase-like monooxygenase
MTSTPAPPAPGDILEETVSGWEGVTTGEGRFGSIRFLVGRRELGHLHRPATLDMPLPPSRKRELVESGAAQRHRFTPPDSGWVTIRIDEERGLDLALELLRERHDHALALRQRGR